jgi:glycosyltransferase involved in cell wall biosynthesis
MMIKTNKEKKEIVFINQSSGYLTIDIINNFIENYDECILITGKLIQRNNPLNTKVIIKKIVPYLRNSKIKRVITWLVAYMQIAFLVLTKYRKADLFIISNPPLSILIPLFCSNPFSLLIYDVYPDVLTEFKYFTDKSVIIKLWKKINYSVFKRAKEIYTISDGMKKIISKYVDSKKIKIIPLWTDNTFLKPVPKEENIFIKQQEVAGKFLVIYSGNVGLTQNVEVLIDLAERVKEKDIFFLIIGDGDKKKILADRIDNSCIPNIRLLPWQDISMYPFSLSSADLAVVTLSKEASMMSVPSKLFDIMAVGSPVLVIAEKNSEVAKIVKNYDIGICCSSDQIEKMINFIDNLIVDKEYYQKLSANSLKASHDFTPDNAIKFVE